MHCLFFVFKGKMGPAKGRMLPACLLLPRHSDLRCISGGRQLQLPPPLGIPCNIPRTAPCVGPRPFVPGLADPNSLLLLLLLFWLRLAAEEDAICICLLCVCVCPLPFFFEVPSCTPRPLLVGS